MAIRADLQGMVFDRLTVLEWVSKEESGHTQACWKCHCVCGNISFATSWQLTSGNNSSCGCLARELASKRSRTRGNSRVSGEFYREYQIWKAIRRRCNTPTDGSYRFYGAKGVIVCDRWAKFENFIADMGKAPEGYSIDRVDPVGNYCPENCRWVDDKTQARNKRDTVYAEWSGVTKPLRQWAEELGFNYQTLYDRYQRGDREDHLFRPTGRVNERNGSS